MPCSSHAMKLASHVTTNFAIYKVSFAVRPPVGTTKRTNTSFNNRSLFMITWFFGFSASVSKLHVFHVILSGILTLTTK